MKSTQMLLSAAGLGLVSLPAFAGTTVVEPVPAPVVDSFTARRPITNPTLFDLAVPTTNIHPIVIYHRLPDMVNTTIGPVPLDGDAQIYAVQAELAIGERWSIVATKDGYVDFNPDTTPPWSDQTGWANIAAGIKYAFILDPACDTALSGTVTFEVPTGNHDVFQGEGDGSVNLILSGLKMWGPAQLAAGGGFSIPFSDQLSTSSFLSGHFSYEICRWFIPLVEVNWFHVLDTGDGRPNFFSQVGGGVPVVAAFEGYDLLNFGAANASRNRDFVTAAVGFRSRLSENIDLGFAYELPLTDEEDGIMDDRFTLDLVWRF